MSYRVMYMFDSALSLRRTGDLLVSGEKQNIEATSAICLSDRAFRSEPLLRVNMDIVRDGYLLFQIFTRQKAFRGCFLCIILHPVMQEIPAREMLLISAQQKG